MSALGNRSGVIFFLMAEPIALLDGGGKQSSWEDVEKSADIAFRCRGNCSTKLKKIKFTTI